MTLSEQRFAEPQSPLTLEGAQAASVSHVTVTLHEHQRLTHYHAAGVLPQVRYHVEWRRVERSVEGSNPRQEPKHIGDVRSG